MATLDGAPNARRGREMPKGPSILRRTSGSRRASIAASVCVLAGGLLLVLSGGGFAAAGSNVVPPSGTVAGHSYAYYLERGWQLYFSSPAPGPRTCPTITVDGQKVALVGGPGGGGGKSTCNEPTGRPIYLPGPEDECSTLPGDHNGFGTTESQLKRCARAGMKGALASASVDGHRISHFNGFITATGVYSIHLPKNRFPGVKQRSGRSAAYGYGLLVIGLTKGTHTLHHAGTVMGDHVEATVRLHVH